MVSACAFGALLGHPDSPGGRLVADGVGRRALMGLAMGTTAVAIIYSPWGKQSGAHLNPSVTLDVPSPRQGAALGRALLRARAVRRGRCRGVVLSAALLGAALRHPSVHYVVTVPGAKGVGVAFVAEVAIASVMMPVLVVSNGPLGSLDRALRRSAGAVATSRSKRPSRA